MLKYMYQSCATDSAGWETTEVDFRCYKRVWCRNKIFRLYNQLLIEAFLLEQKTLQLPTL